MPAPLAHTVLGMAPTEPPDVSAWHTQTKAVVTAMYGGFAGARLSVSNRGTISFCAFPEAAPQRQAGRERRRGFLQGDEETFSQYVQHRAGPSPLVRPATGTVSPATLQPP